ncbi:MAG: type I 3-dehydroquinate dehydratase, partial [Spirochaetales bacterium]|nr:type I 3-dehydroquinate dehydratase [Spirochaetales bacterium]
MSDWTRQLDRNRRWISTVELRVDLLKPAERSPTALSEWWSGVREGLSAILTIRRPRDLGRWEGDEAQRLFLLSQLVDVLEPDYLDLELDRVRSPGWVELARGQYDRGGAVVRSHHDPKATPAELAPLIARLAADPHEVPKLAVYPDSCSDVKRLLDAVQEFHRRMPGREGIWIAMGEYGLPSRVAPSHFGSAWTYTSDDDGFSAALGHVSPRVLHETYRVGEARADWPLFAVAGAPVAHSRSPEYHNRRFREDGRAALYIPVRADDFTEFEALAERLGFRGVSVTVPHKRAALAFAGDGASERARSVGAANTVWTDRDGRRRADNT